MKAMKALISVLALALLIRPSAAASGPVRGQEGLETALTAGEKTAGTGEAKAEAREDPAPPKMPFETPAFWGTRLVNLPTTTTIDAKDVLFRISHRFYGPVAEGYDTFFGLDSGANVLFSLGYGITDRLSISVGRARLYSEWELGLDWLVLEQGGNTGLPFSATLHAGADWVTMEGSGTVKGSFQVSLARQVNKRLSLLVVPAFATNTNFWELDPRGTFSLGLGSRYMIFNELSVILEWIPVLSGYKDVQNGWGFGIEKKIGGHVFQVVLTNAFGLTGSQFVPGGDLRLQDLDFRIGFNIFRTF